MTLLGGLNEDPAMIAMAAGIRTLWPRRSAGAHTAHQQVIARANYMPASIWVASRDGGAVVREGVFALQARGGRRDLRGVRPATDVTDRDGPASTVG